MCHMGARRLFDDSKAWDVMWSGPHFQVALCAGAGSDMLDDATSAGADAFVTGEMRHHDALKAVREHIHFFEGRGSANSLPNAASVDCCIHGLAALSYLVSMA